MRPKHRAFLAFTRSITALFVTGILAGPSFAQIRQDPAAILREYDALVPPRFEENRRSDLGYQLEHRQKVNEVAATRAALAAEFVKAFPTHRRAVELQRDRLVELLRLNRYTEAVDESEAALNARPAPSGPALEELHRIHAMATVRQSRHGWLIAAEAVEKYIAVSRRNEQGVTYLNELAQRVQDPSLKMAVYIRLSELYTGTPKTRSQGEIDKLLKRGIRAQRFPPETPGQRDLLRKIRRVPGPVPLGRQDLDIGNFEREAEEQAEYAATIGPLYKQFYDQFPEHPEAVYMMAARWRQLARIDQTAMAIAEADDLYTASARQRNAALQATTRFLSLRFQLETAKDEKFKVAVTRFEEYRRLAPGDYRMPDLLLARATGDPDETIKTTLLNQVIREYKDSDAATLAAQRLRQLAQPPQR